MLVALTLCSGVLPACAPETDGAVVFDQHCASCHREPLWPRAPNLEMMQDWAPDVIVTALSAGAMTEEGRELTVRERMAVAEYISSWR